MFCWHFTTELNAFTKIIHISINFLKEESNHSTIIPSKPANRNPTTCCTTKHPFPTPPIWPASTPNPCRCTTNRGSSKRPATMTTITMPTTTAAVAAAAAVAAVAITTAATSRPCRCARPYRPPIRTPITCSTTTSTNSNATSNTSSN